MNNSLQIHPQIRLLLYLCFVLNAYQGNYSKYWFGLLQTIQKMVYSIHSEPNPMAYSNAIALQLHPRIKYCFQCCNCKVVSILQLSLLQHSMKSALEEGNALFLHLRGDGCFPLINMNSLLDRLYLL